MIYHATSYEILTCLNKGMLEVILITRIVKKDNSSLSAICEKILNTEQGFWFFVFFFAQDIEWFRMAQLCLFT